MSVQIGTVLRPGPGVRGVQEVFQVSPGERFKKKQKKNFSLRGPRRSDSPVRLLSNQVQGRRRGGEELHSDGQHGVQEGPGEVRLRLR